ncbi:MAG: hypothetical protein V3T83_00360, partial [Acidobacteriota bacterium]
RPAEVPPSALERKLNSKGEIVKALEASFGYCEGAFVEPRMSEPNSGPFNFKNRGHALGLVVYHDSQHYGNLVTYLRLAGLVPPTGETRLPFDGADKPRN